MNIGKASKSFKRCVDYSLYLVTDDKFLKDKENVCGTFINKIIQGVLGGVGLIQLRLKKSDDIYFYNTAVKLKNLLIPFNIPLIINNRLDICLSVNADGVHLGKSDIPLYHARNILGENKIIGATINFSDEKDIEMCINNRIDYIAHDHTLYESTTKKTIVSNEQGLKEQIRILENKIKYLYDKGKLIKNHNNTDVNYKNMIPPIILIGGINTNNIKNTMISFSNTCEGLAVVSCILDENSPSFINTLKLKYVIDKYKKSHSVAFINMYSSCLNYLYYQNIELKEQLNLPVIFQSTKQKMNAFLVTNMILDKNKLYFIPFKNNDHFDIITLNEFFKNSEKANVFLFHSSYDLFLNNNNKIDSSSINGILNKAKNSDDKYENIKDEIIKRINQLNDIIKKEHIGHNIFILIGEEICNLFNKNVYPQIFNSNYFFIIKKHSSIQSRTSEQWLYYDTKNACIQYNHNVINIFLKNEHFFSEENIKKFGLLMSYFLIVQDKNITPQFLQQIETQGETNFYEQTLWKFIATVDISLKLIENSMGI
ncbi:thiamin-phosphate pyrophosphorylase, putative [Plasmodium sp. gorilla clade G2]|uniref:thiamin-phosphate pyrophosphorylase, putative n=1 Tax=Plasmodium sp. gorilla clade G2 TaxID=880535 RepID=UPI000D210A93|nr:thiamin-phosphate pyrophosphorylase, putative [Plasmodium sp. gorilla clade G2]SOV12554.1 thiamin-phosphate pyrophosphorylase, putative [Plasmodium sp. gorilla clade G2]